MKRGKTKGSPVGEKRHPGSSTLLLVHRDGGDLYIALGS